ncbi:hypothetical protein HQN89_15390 [Paenibacillus frigoriresistens]|uniref:hypothetical protein n=1 Tax=Paenibacillus alginolyticus TaxID=59839 RepID=UPI00156787E7|nr:hypothetical protein [Paenibacillus frigoriresistens]NRF92392.1 hypothetical protein [Paenibacillus frigoriresistens]
MTTINESLMFNGAVGDPITMDAEDVVSVFRYAPYTEVSGFFGIDAKKRDSPRNWQ